MEIKEIKVAKATKIKAQPANAASISNDLFRMNIGRTYTNDLKVNQVIASFHLQKNGQIMGTSFIDGQKTNCKVIVEQGADIKEYNHSLYVCDIVSYDERKGMWVKPQIFLSKTKHSFYDVQVGLSIIDIESNQIVGIINDIELREIKGFKIVNGERNNYSYVDKIITFFLKGEEESVFMIASQNPAEDMFGDWIKSETLFIV